MSQAQPDGYLAMPPAGSEAPVLVLHAWWGLNDDIRGLIEQLAEAGFVAIAPDLYHGKIAATIPEAEVLGQGLDSDGARVDIARAMDYLGERAGGVEGGVAVIGFSLGAYYALELSVSDPRVRKVVVFYGAGPEDFQGSQADYLTHWAENDPYEPKEYTDATEAGIRAAGRPLSAHTYPGTGHWFFEPSRPDAYNPKAAALAWERTLAFLRSSAS